MEPVADDVEGSWVAGNSSVVVAAPSEVAAAGSDETCAEG